jgi:hypothetical protein
LAILSNFERVKALTLLEKYFFEWENNLLKILFQWNFNKSENFIYPHNGCGLNVWPISWVERPILRNKSGEFSVERADTGERCVLNCFPNHVWNLRT